MQVLTPERTDSQSQREVELIHSPIGHDIEEGHVPLNDDNNGNDNDDVNVDRSKGININININSGEEKEQKQKQKRKELQDIKEYTPIEILVLILAFASFSLSIAAVAMHVKYYRVRSACAIMFLLSPYSYYQQTRITDIRALKETFLVLKGEVDKMIRENTRLKATVGGLKDAVDKLENTEQVLAALEDTKGKSIESLKASVEENKANVEALETNMQMKVLENIFQVVRDCDVNNDGQISDKETKTLIRRLKDLGDIKVDEKKIIASMKEGNGSVEAVRSIVVELLDDSQDAHGIDAMISFEEEKSQT